jgi:hypothetical protein
VKLKFILIVLSVLIIAASGYIVWWILTQAVFQIETPIREGGKITGYAMLTPPHETLVDATQYMAAPALLLALWLLMASILHKTKIQIALGAIIAAAAVFTGIFGFPTEFISAAPLDGETIKHIFTSPVGAERTAMMLSFFECILGLAAVGVGIAQLVKSEKKATI